jgi:SAM-dependent methyltransferase
MFEDKNTWVHYLRGSAYALRLAIGNAKNHFGYRYNERAVKVLRLILPYCLHPIKNKPELLIWLNRDYKPLGILPFKLWVRYEEFPWMHVSADNPNIAHLLNIKSIKKSIKEEIYTTYWLFDDFTAPWNGSKEAQKLLQLIEATYTEEESL